MIDPCPFKRDTKGEFNECQPCIDDFRARLTPPKFTREGWDVMSLLRRLFGCRGREDITPGWQDRVAQLRATIRNCQHKGKRLMGENAQFFCAICGRHLNDDGSEA